MTNSNKDMQCGDTCALPRYDIYIKNDQEFILNSNNTKLSKNLHIQYTFDISSYKSALFRCLPSRFADIVDIAKAVYLTDKISSRKNHHNINSLHRGWKRKFKLTIPVRDISFWNSHNLYEQLTSTLYFLTEDDWSFEFIKKTSGASTSNFRQGDFLFEVPKKTIIALFSGGLDSYAGVSLYLKDHKPTKTFLVSIVTNSRMKGVQQRLTNSLRKNLNLDILNIPFRISLKACGVPEHLQEKSQRSRGFLFHVLGSVFAILAGQNTLNLFENGIRAINLPMVDFQLGTDNSRAVNPLTLIELSKLISMVTERPFEITNKALWLTKGELYCQILNTPFQNEISRTCSCDGSFSRRIRKKPQCGLCTSCLLRRESLLSASLLKEDKSSNYQFDIYQPQSLDKKDRLFSYEAMKFQVRKLRTCLEADNPWLALIKEYPMLEELKLKLCSNSSFKRVSIEKRIMNLYLMYIREWQNFEQRVN